MPQGNRVDILNSRPRAEQPPAVRAPPDEGTCHPVALADAHITVDGSPIIWLYARTYPFSERRSRRLAAMTRGRLPCLTTGLFANVPKARWPKRVRWLPFLTSPGERNGKPIKADLRRRSLRRRRRNRPQSPRRARRSQKNQNRPSRRRKATTGGTERDCAEHVLLENGRVSGFQGCFCG